MWGCYIASWVDGKFLWEFLLLFVLKLLGRQSATKNHCLLGEKSGLLWTFLEQATRHYVMATGVNYKTYQKIDKSSIKHIFGSHFPKS